MMKSITKRPLNLVFGNHSSDRSVVSTETEETELEKFVSFASHATMYETIARQNYTQEEIKATWYSQDEYLQISKQCCKQIQKMNRGERLRDKKYCSRGLEAHTTIGLVTKMRNRAESIQAVLEEQEVQRIKEGIHDEDTIADLYNEVTSSCQLWARTVALRDQREAEAYLDDELAGPTSMSHDDYRDEDAVANEASFFAGSSSTNFGDGSTYQHQLGDSDSERNSALPTRRRKRSVIVSARTA